MPAHNMQFRKRRFSWLFEAFCPAKSFVTVDNDDTRIPPHAILPDVAYYPVINPKKQDGSTYLKHSYRVQVGEGGMAIDRYDTSMRYE